MSYCVECGAKLKDKYFKGEGDIPFCSRCDEYRFPMFNTAVSMIIMNSDRDKILLIQQYGRKDFILVAGYINKGESAETAVEREIEEELGMEVTSITYNSTRYYDRTNTLMINYACLALDEDLSKMTEEVDYAEWFLIDEARKQIKKDSLAQSFLELYLGKPY